MKPSNVLSPSTKQAKPFSKSNYQGGGGGGSGIKTIFNPPKLVPSSFIPTEFFQPSTYTCQSEYLKHMIKYFNLDNPAPYISARSWIMTNLDTGEVLYAK